MLHPDASSMVYAPAFTLADMGKDGKTMGERLREARIAAGLSQTALAKKAGVTKGAISQYENSTIRGMRPDKFLILCNTLSISPYWLVWGEERIGTVLEDALFELAPVGPGRMDKQGGSKYGRSASTGETGSRSKARRNS